MEILCHLMKTYYNILITVCCSYYQILYPRLCMAAPTDCSPIDKAVSTLFILLLVRVLTNSYGYSPRLGLTTRVNVDFVGTLVPGLPFLTVTVDIFTGLRRHLSINLPYG